MNIKKLEKSLQKKFAKDFAVQLAKCEAITPNNKKLKKTK